MKFKSYLKASRKKSFASLFLAVLMMISFNSSPIMLLSSSIRTSRAYKSSETQTYYTGATSSDEKSFDEAQVPDSLLEYFEGSSHKYNILKQYTEKFDQIYKTTVDAFFENYENANLTYAQAYDAFLANFNNASSLSVVFTNEKDSNFLKLNLEEISFSCFAETLAINGFSEYDTNKTKSIPALTTPSDSKFIELSEFYRLLADYAEKKTLDGGTDPDSADHPNNSITTAESFYKSNTHYLRLKAYIDGEIAKLMPAYAFDGITQDANIAAIFAQAVPTIIEYNYVSNSYTKFSAPSAKYVTVEPTGMDKLNEIYYFGNLSEIAEQDGYKDYSAYFSQKTLDKSSADIFFYRPTTIGEPGYIDRDHPTYYKYANDSYPYVSSNSTKLSVYVLNNAPTQSDLDTYASVYFTHITSQDLLPVDGSNFYVNIPLENDKIYFKSVYNSLLFSQQGFTYEEFEDYFTNSNDTSNLYLKYGNKDSEYCRYVYIEENDYLKFKEAYPKYEYMNYLKTFKASTFKAKDYVLITGTSNKSYLPVKDSNNPLHVDYNLYFEKTKKYYEEPIASEYSQTEFEKTYAPVVNLEKQAIASGAYVPKFEGSNERKIYVLDDAETRIELNSVVYDCVTQSEIDTNPNFYVAVPNSLYPNNIDNNIYKLYYKHTAINADKIYIVDNADSAATNKVYQTLNYNVIGSFELEDNYINYLAIKEGDVNYNKNYQLYYKYDRTPIEDVVYILKRNIINEDLFNALDHDHDKYKSVGDGELADYSLIDPTEKESLYSTVRTALDLTESNELHLYYKLSNVFVQNALKDGNAIYVINSSPGKTEKADYTQYNYTPITSKEVENNPNLYVALTEKDPNWRNQKDLKLYYKYIQSSQETNTVYSIDDIDTSASDFDKNAYQLIAQGQPGYKAGQENYYKRILVKENTKIIEDTPSYYYYQTPKGVTLTANSYYVVSFYVQTIGNNARASFYIKDTANVISDIKLENISTSGKWEKYYVYISTDITTASTVKLYLYLGDEEHGVKGDTDVDDFLTASIFFDEIKITKIGLSDYNKFTIDNQLIYTPDEPESQSSDSSEESTEPVEPSPFFNDYKTGIYDEYNNRIYIANLESDSNYVTNTRFTSNVYDYKKYISSSMDVFGSYSWDDMFNFDNDNEDLHNILGHYSTAENATNISNSLSSTLSSDIEGYDMYDSNFNSLWRYYFSRDLANEFTIEKYRQAYQDNLLNVSITNQIEQSEEKDDEENSDKKDDEEDTTEESKDIVYVSSPFNYNNYALKLENKHQDISLGITSNSFTVKQFEYYKITVWIYSPDLDGTATLSINSVMKTRQSPTYGSLLTSSVSSTYANVDKSSSKESEYGWIPVTLFIEGNNYQDMECYLVLSADADCTVYFDNITIEKTTSDKFDSALSNASSSNKYTCGLSLIPSTSIITTDLKNGSFDFVKTTEFDHPADSIVPYAPDSWSTTDTITKNSSRAIAGVVSTQHSAFFNKYANSTIPYEGIDTFSNIFAIYAPKDLKALNEINDSGYLHNYAISSAGVSLSANAVYQFSFKFYKGADFDGSLIANLYLTSVKAQNLISAMEIDDADIDDGWQTYTFYLATGTDTGTAKLEIGVKNATGISYFKSVTSKKLTGKTLDSLMDEVAKENNLSSTDNFESLPNIKFVSRLNMDFSNHTPTINESTGLFDQKVMTDKTEISTKYTNGKNGVVVASYFTSNYTTTYSVTINKITYYIGEVYNATINETEYFIQKTYDKVKNVFEYTMYSDSDLKNKVTHINDETITILIEDGVKVKVGSSEPYTTTTSYRLYRFSDLREEVRVLDGATVSVPSLDKVVIGSGSSATENTATSTQNTSYDYHFSTDNEIIINNTIIPASALDNAQSGKVLILSNSYSTDYITLTQTSANTLGKSTYNVLRIYVKTSDFESDDVGLNINIKAINTSWTNINTTNSTKTDKYGFVCYEVLIRSNSSDSIADFAVQLSLGSENKTCSGYAIISEISLTALSSADEFEHYSALVGDDNENIKKSIYAEKAKTTSSTNNKTDDENSVSWATFFYIFSSLLLVLTMAVAMVAILLKKHPIKATLRYSNEHDRDIETVAGKKSKTKTTHTNKDVVIGELAIEEKPKNEGGIE